MDTPYATLSELHTLAQEANVPVTVLGLMDAIYARAGEHVRLERCSYGYFARLEDACLGDACLYGPTPEQALLYLWGVVCNAPRGDS